MSSALLAEGISVVSSAPFDGLVIGDLVVDIGLVEGRAVELGEFGALGGGLLGQRLAGVVVFRRDLELLDQRERLLVHRGMVAHHVVGESADVLVLGFRQRLLGGLDVELPRRVGDMGDLRIGRLGALARTPRRSAGKARRALRQI